MRNWGFMAYGMWVLGLILGGFMGVCGIVSLILGEALWWKLMLCALGYAALSFLCRSVSKRISRQKQELIVSLSACYRIVVGLWILVPLLGSLPYLITGTLDSFTNAMFESISGFTTTGSSVIMQPENISRGMLLWRSCTQWIGGLGLVMLVIMWTRDERIGNSGAGLMEAEFSGVRTRRLHPQLSKSIRKLWWIYVILTLVAAGGLWLCGNDLIESLCIGMSGVSTGGFMTRSNGLTDMGISTMAVATLIMILSGINVGTIYNALKIKQNRDEELKVYLGAMAIGVICCVAGFAAERDGIGKALGYGIFHVASTISTCGFFAEGYESWPISVTMVTLVLIVVGACSGSTGGGLKWKRVMIVMRFVKGYFTKMLHPNAVTLVRIDGNRVEDEYVGKVFAFVFLYVLVLIGGAFLLTIDGETMVEGLTLAATNIGNLGPNAMLKHVGLEVMYVNIGAFGKWTLIGMMLAGRLEVFAIIGLIVNKR